MTNEQKHDQEADLTGEAPQEAAPNREEARPSGDPARDAGTPRPVAAPDSQTSEAQQGPTAEDMLRDFESIMMEVNKGVQQLKRFESTHQYLIAPNIYRHWEESLRETGLTMSREFQRMRDSARSTPQPRSENTQPSDKEE